MIPVRVTPPVGPLLTLAQLRVSLGEDADGDTIINELIEDLERAAVSRLDGPFGDLGRCIQTQTWSVKYPGPGRYRLPFPDVTAVVVDAGTCSVDETLLFPMIEVSEACTAHLTAGMGSGDLAMARSIVRLLVGHWFLNREAVVTGTITAVVPEGVDTMIARLRWGLL